MGKTLVETVVEMLGEAGFSVQRAYPGTVMQDVTDLELTVQWAQLDQKAKTATVQIMVFSPAGKGAAVCQDEAVAVCLCLQSGGGSCVMKKTAYDPDMYLFGTEILASFTGEQTADGWIPILEETEQPTEEQE